MKVDYIDHMGDDLLVANAARVSFNKHRDEFGSGDEKLLGYLAKNNHWTPYAHPQICLRMDAPVPIRTQCYKHKQGFVENEVSRRYTDEDVEFYMPDGWRGKPTDGAKQGSSDVRIERILFHGIAESWEADVNDLVANHYATSLGLFEDMVAGGICVEQARFVLPQGMMCKWYWTGSLSAFSRFYKLRSDSHAQGEIQELAKMVGEIIEPLFPVAWKMLTRPTVTLDLGEYNSLKEDAEWLAILYAAGIDNSEAYDYACQLRDGDDY